MTQPGVWVQESPLSQPGPHLQPLLLPIGAHRMTTQAPLRSQGSGSLVEDFKGKEGSLQAPGAQEARLPAHQGSSAWGSAAWSP